MRIYNLSKFLLLRCDISLKTRRHSVSSSFKFVSNYSPTFTISSKIGGSFENIRCLCTSSKEYVKESNFSEKNRETSIIYCGSLTYMVKGIKVFTCISSMGGIMIYPWLLPKLVGGDNLPLGVALFSCLGFFTFVTPFLIHLMTKKYVTEIWYNSTTDTYTATLLSFFLRKINIDFKLEDIQVPSALPVFSTMYIKGRPVFIISESFLEMDHYIKMMQYDKPMDFELNMSQKADSSKKS